MQSKILNTSANYTAATNDGYEYIYVSTSGGNRTVTLPDNVTNKGRRFVITKTTTDTNYITVARSGIDTIRGSANSQIIGSTASTTGLSILLGGTLTLVSDGNGDWKVEGGLSPRGTKSAFGTQSSVTFGNVAQVSMTFDPGTYLVIGTICVDITGSTANSDSVYQIQIDATSNAINDPIPYGLTSVVYKYPAAATAPRWQVSNIITLTATTTIYFKVRGVSLAGAQPTSITIRSDTAAGNANDSTCIMWTRLS